MLSFSLFFRVLLKSGPIPVTMKDSMSFGERICDAFDDSIVPCLHV